MKKKWAKKLFRKFMALFDTFPEVFSKKCIGILENKEGSRELMVAIENDQNHPNANSPTRYRVRRIY